MFLSFLFKTLLPDESCLQRPSTSHVSAAFSKLLYQFEHALWLLKLRQMTGFGDELEAGVGERLRVGTTICGIDHAIALSPQHEDGDVHTPGPPPQLWIGHVQPLLVEVERLNFCRSDSGRLRTHARRVNAEGCWIVEAEGL